MSYNEYSDCETYEEEPFDESVLTPEQKLQVDDEHQEYPTITREDLAIMIRLNLLSRRAAFEGRNVTPEEVFEAHALKTVIDWTPPSQLEGTCNQTLETDHFEEISLPCIEMEVSSSLLLVDECLDLPCESQDKVDYSLVDSTNLEIDFIFPPNAFDSPTQMNINEHYRKYFSFVETCFNKFVNTNFNQHLVLLVWTIVFLLAQFVYCENRRRTKGPLAQPFDSCD